jgi:diguanylate cyclase (GGDEF)-like protein
VSRRAANIVLLILAGGVLLHCGHALFGPDREPYDAIAEDWIYTFVEFAGTALIFARVFSERSLRWPWAAIGVGMLLWSLGDLLWTLWLDNLESPPYPSFVDAVYFASYAGLYVGIIGLSRTRHSSWHEWIDGLIGGLATAAVGIALIFPAVLAATEGSTTTVAVTLAYPLLDVLLLGFVIVAIGVNRWRPDPAWLLLAAGLAVTAVADAIFNYQSSVGTYVAGSLLDSMWPIAVLFIAAAAWRPARPGIPADGGRRSALIPVLFASAALALLCYAGLREVAPLAVVLAAGALCLGVFRAAMLMAENRRLLANATQDALSDGLTGLANRRALVRDLDAYFTSPGAHGAQTLALFDLDGFKSYNDMFGHAAGDELLIRLADSLAEAVASRATAYRLGGDEFCLLIPGEAAQELLDAATEALSSSGEHFTVTTSAGAVVMPREAPTARDALMLADARMYADKGTRSGSGRGQVREVLLQVLSETEPELHRHMSHVSRLAHDLSRHMGLPVEQVDVTVRAAELHDVGKIAIPDSILNKPGPLNLEEISFMRKHTLIGERIVAAASALRPVARVVRSSHERWDGGGYPDGLAGEAIPIEARIVFVCDAYDAMTSDRPYAARRTSAEALAEMERNAGTQFDPVVVEALTEVLAAQAAAPSSSVIAGGS